VTADEAISPFSVLFDTHDESSPWRFSCKEMFDVDGYPANCGHPRFGQNRAGNPSSAVVALFQRVGATLVGKTLQSELAFSGLGENRHFQLPANPTRPGYVAGGSSTGCAVAVARGLVDFSIATDSAGSARIPAACCDVLGMSLANQTRWLNDAVTLSPTLDQVGMLASSLHGLLQPLQHLVCLDGPDTPDRVVVPRQLLQATCSPTVLERFEVVCERLGALGVEVLTTDSNAFEEVERIQRTLGTLVLAEIAASLSPFLMEHEADVSTSISDRLQPYREWAPDRIRKLREFVRQPLAEYRSHFSEPLLLPTLPVTPPRIGSNKALGTLTKYSNLVGENSLSVPVPSAGLSIMFISPEPTSLLQLAELLRPPA